VTQMPNILIVDDEEVVRRSFSRVLDGAHCRTASVVDGEQALRALASERYDVVLLDLRMPGADGIAMLKAIKARWPDSEVVVITGYPSIETAKEAVRLGAFDYLAKPVAPDTVIHAARGAALRKRWAMHTVVNDEVRESARQARSWACQ
jgi:DNA-binding NtrC family response regulator